MRRPQRHRHCENAAFIEDARGANCAAMKLFQLLHEHEGDPGSFVGAPARAFDAMKPVEEPRNFMLGNSGAGVLHFQNRIAAVLPQAHGDAARGSIVVRNRTVGKGIVGLLGVAITLHNEELGLDIRALHAGHCRRQHRLDIVPNFLPHFGRGPPQCPMVLAADDCFIRIVVEVDRSLATSVGARSA